MRTRGTFVVILLCALSSCSSEPKRRLLPPDATLGADSGPAREGGVDASTTLDAGYDSGTSASADAAVDSGPIANPDSGPYDSGVDSGSCACALVTECCDGCHPINDHGSCSDDSEGTYDDKCIAGSCSGTPCECLSGPCCDGCLYLASGFQCGDNVTVARSCATAPGVRPGRRSYQLGDVYCSGVSSECDGEIDYGNWYTAACPDNDHQCLGGMCVY